MLWKKTAGKSLVAAITIAALISCTGDTGPTGPAGATGAAGPAGPAGPSGPAGAGTESFVSTLSGANEQPPVITTATGTAAFTRVGDLLTFRLDVAGITSVTAAHIHGPAAAGVNAPILVDLYIPPAGTTFTGSATLAQGVAVAPRAGVNMDSVYSYMRAGNAYVNVHTTANASGHIRGQIARKP